MIPTDVSRKLRVLGWVYYSLGVCGLLMTAAGFPVIRNVLNAVRRQAAPPPVVLVLKSVLVLSLVASAAMGVAIIRAGYSMRTCRHRHFCIVVSALICLSVPIGTIIGIFALIVLSRPDVKDGFR